MAEQIGPRARTTLGTVRGLAHEGLASFRGIPYAAPPVGPLRFRSPQPCAPWTGVRSSIEFGAVPPQPSPAIALTGNRAANQSEDCLTLNVLTPSGVANPTDADPADEPLPVVVHLHSGSYLPGSVSVPAFDGSTLVRNGNVVYVSVNHRVGALG